MDAPLQRLREGAKPTTLLRELRNRRGGIRNFDLSRVFLDEIWNDCNATDRLPQYDGLDTHDLLQPIWHWQDSRERPGGHTDEAIDQIVIRVLKEAGLLDEPSQSTASTEQGGGGQAATRSESK